MEAAANIRYILHTDRNSRFLSWLRAYVEHDEKQILQWNRVSDAMDATEKTEHDVRISARRRALEFRKDFLDSAEREFATISTIDSTLRFPNVADRFSQIDESAAYRTAYARLSSQTHVDAEDTINYVFFKMRGDEKALEHMSLETIAFSEYMVLFGTRFYLLALRAMIETFGLRESGPVANSLAVVEEQMNEIGTEWKW